jgi:uncharacterized membrane protein
MAGLYSLLGSLRHWHFQSNGCDLGIFDQVVWHYSRFERPTCTVSGFSNLLGDHFHPALVLLAPLYWIVPKVETLLVAQALLLTFPMVLLFFFAQPRIGKFGAIVLALSYSVLGGIQSAANFDFHELCMAVTFTALAIHSMDSKKNGLFYLSIFLLVMSKEDMYLLAAFFGILKFLKGERRSGAALTVGSFLLLLVELKFVIPFMGGPGNTYHHWAYSQLGSGPVEALKTMVSHPLRTMGLLVSNQQKITTLSVLFAPFLFFGLFSRYALLAVPLLCERLLSDDPTFWGFNYQHYSAVLAVVVAFASADGFPRVMAWIRAGDRLRSGLLWAVLLLNFSLLPVKHYSKLSTLFKPSYYRLTENDRTGEEALKRVPEGASVMAQSPIVPHLSHRSDIYLMSDIDLARHPDEEYLVACDRLDVWPFDDLKPIEKYLKAKGAAGYSRVYEKDGWVVLKRGKAD